MAPKRKVTSRRRAKQFSLPFPLTQAQQATYRSPHWQQRINTYAQNYLLPVELAHCQRLGLRFLPMEAEIVQRQLIGTTSLMRKVQTFIGSLYVYDAAYALMREMREQMENVLAAGENVNDGLVVNLMNNIRGYQLLKLQPGVAANAANYIATIGNVGYGRANPIQPADPAVNLTVLSPSQENMIRSKGYAVVEGVPYTVGRVPDVMDAPGRNGNDPPAVAGMTPYAVRADGTYAVESCINQLIELANARKIRTDLFSIQSRAAVFYPLGLEQSAAGTMYEGVGALRTQIDRANMEGFGNLMTNLTRRPAANAIAGAVAAGGDLNPAAMAAYEFDNVLRQISVPASATGLARTMNAAVLEVQKMTITQRDLLADFGQWVATGMGILAMDGVEFGEYMNPIDAAGQPDTRKIMGNKPRTMKYLEANYTNDSCGQGFKRLWYTDDPANPKSRQVPGYLPSSTGGMVKNPEARVAVCAPFSRQRGALPIGRGDETFTDTTFAVRPRGAVAANQRRKTVKRKTPAKKRTTATRSRK